ncbi:MAG: SDR family oxidoreductase [Alphaproteobacteria bacterium]|nr:SDR family oxidoreductase [Alphaproteobacteria bacterium]
MAYKPFDLTGKVALITGGNGGIGLGMAKALAEAGADIAIWGTKAAKNKAAKEKLAATGKRIETFEIDVTDEKAVDQAFGETVTRLGRIDSCFANSGVSGAFESFAKASTEEWHRVLKVNLDGSFFTLRAATRHMISRPGGGSIAAVASLAAISGAARGEHYAATKGGLISMMKAMAVEFARYGIRANAILPGWIETEMTEKKFAWDKFRDAVLPRVPMRRWGKPEDFGGIAVYLVSDASAFHTGDSFLIDGGYWVF